MARQTGDTQMKLIRAIVHHFVGYDAYVVWERDVYIHRAWTERGALAWVACYPRNSQARVERALTGYIHATRIA